MPETVLVAVLPALSVQVALEERLAPSPVTASLYHPAPFGARSGAALIVGAVLSMLTTAVLVAELPALSVAVPETCWPSPSVVLETGALQPATPEPPWSAQVKVTVTSWLVH